jgi:hypothetical protein
MSAMVGPARGGDFGAPRPRVVDVAKAKAQESEKQRLLARLRAEVPKVHEVPSGANALDAPIFHRYDRP